jgi:hypothetical protein
LAAAAFAGVRRRSRSASGVAEPLPRAAAARRFSPAPQWAQAEHGHYPYVAAYASASALDLVRSEAVAADRECGAMSAKEQWEPPPPDAEPETAQDYE